MKDTKSRDEIVISILYKIVNYLRRVNQRLLHFSTLGVKALVVNSQQQILLVEHTYTDGWHLPGGGIDSGETPKMAICRELKEETGLTVSADDLILFSIYWHQIHGANDYPILYIVKKYEEISDAPKSPEIKQIGWFAPHDLPVNTPIYTRQRIQEYLQNLPASEAW